MKKRFIGVLLMFLVVLSTITFADDEVDNCAGVWGLVKCFLWGNPANRAGQSWWARGEALVGN